MSWPKVNIQIESCRTPYEERMQLYEQMESVNARLLEHFGEGLPGNWMDYFYTSKLYSLIDPVVLTQNGYCEFCTNYMGVNPFVRRFKNVYVIRSFCSKQDKGVKPDYRCNQWKPNMLHEDRIWFKLRKMLMSTRYSFEEYWEDRRKEHFGYTPYEEY